VQHIFSRYRTEFNYKYSNYPKSLGKYIELDIFIPELSLAFEYNGEQHYKFVPIYNQELQKIQQRDQFKQMICKDNGITLITIPFWWDKTIESVASTIHYLRPDISMPPEFLFKKPAILNQIPLQGKKNSKTHTRSDHYHLRRAKVLPNKFNTTGWLMLEQYNGIHVFWDGKDKLITKHGKVMQVPQ